MKLFPYCRSLLFIYLCLVSGYSMAVWNDKIWASPIDTDFNFYQVSDLLYRSALPDSSKQDIISQQRIATIITLIKEDDRKWLENDTGVQLIRYPTHADRVKDDDVLEVLRLIRQSEVQGKSVLLHCKHGQNRTGLFVAMYRIVVQGWTKEQALDELRNVIPSVEDKDVREAMAYIQKANIKGIRKALSNNKCSTSKMAFCQLWG